LSQRRVLSTNRLELERLDSSVDEQPYDVLRPMHERTLTCQKRRCAFNLVGRELLRGSESLMFHDSSLEAEGGCLGLKNAEVISGGFGGSVPYESPRRGSRVYDPPCEHQRADWKELDTKPSGSHMLGKRSLHLRDLSRVRLKALACLLCAFAGHCGCLVDYSSS